MEQIMMYIMAAGCVIGGLDKIFGNRLGLGEKFTEGFRLLGPVALAQAGIICLAPVISSLLSPAVSAVCGVLRQDPGMFGSILAIDMGGYQMALLLAQDELVGRFAGIVAAAMLGCTITFTIPVGMGFIGREQQASFARGVLCGMIAMPFAMLLGAVLCGIPLLRALWICLPVLLIAAVMGVGIIRWPQGMIRCFRVFAGAVNVLITLGLILGAVQYMTGWTILPGLTPLEEAMQVVSAIGIVLLGSLPVAELLQRALKRPMAALGSRLGMQEKGMVNMLICFISVTPALASLRDMEERDVTMNAAFSVCAASCLSAHLGFVLAMDRPMTAPMIAAKLLGGVLGAAIAYGLFCRRKAA